MHDNGESPTTDDGVVVIRESTVRAEKTPTLFCGAKAATSPPHGACAVAHKHNKKTTEVLHWFFILLILLLSLLLLLSLAVPKVTQSCGARGKELMAAVRSVVCCACSVACSAKGPPPRSHHERIVVMTMMMTMAVTTVRSQQHHENVCDGFSRLFFVFSASVLPADSKRS